MRVGIVVVVVLVACGGGGSKTPGDGAVDTPAAHDGFSDSATGYFGFGSAQPVTTSPGCLVFAAADLDGDGRADLVSSCSDGMGGGQRKLEVLPNTTVGASHVIAFGSPVDLALPDGSDPATDAIVAADLDGDGRLDLVYGASNTGLDVFVNQTTTAGQPRFSAFMTVDAAAAAHVAVADINLDSRPDLITVPGTYQGSAAVLLNTTIANATVPTFATPSTFSLSADSQALVAADINKDGAPDLVVAAGPGKSVFFNTTMPGAQTPSFAPESTVTDGWGPLLAADLDGDGLVDLIQGDYNANALEVQRNMTTPGSTTATFSSATAVAANGVTSEMLGDFDQDGRPDVVVARYYPTAIDVYLDQSGAGNLTLTAQPDVHHPAPWVAVAADLDRDGKLDIVSSENPGSTTLIFVAR